MYVCVWMWGSTSKIAFSLEIYLVKITQKLTEDYDITSFEEFLFFLFKSNQLAIWQNQSSLRAVKVLQAWLSLESYKV